MFRHLQKILILVLFAFNCHALAKQKPNSKRKSVGIKIWKKTMAIKAPKMVCGKKGLLRSCYNISLKECRHQVKVTTPRCLSSLSKRKGRVRLPEQGARLGGELGLCFYRQIIQHRPAMKKKRKSSCA